MSYFLPLPTLNIINQFSPMQFISFLYLIFLLKITVSQSQSQSPLWTFDKYCQQFNKNYTDPTQYARRKSIFDQSVAFILANSNENVTFGFTKFSDYSYTDMQAMKGLIPSTDSQQTSSQFIGDNLVGSSPTSLNWATNGGVSPVRDQGGCGCCWAFATVANAESLLMIAGLADNTINLSEQALLMCTQGSSCTGGYLSYAHRRATDYGLPSESDYPYLASDTGSSAVCSASTRKIANSYATYYSLTDSQLINLLQSGPVASTISSNGWNNYVSGVYSCPNTVSTVIDHGILIVGYTPTYWIIKNQWGTSWGLNGYIWISRSTTGKANCLIGSEVDVFSGALFGYQASALFVFILLLAFFY